MLLVTTTLSMKVNETNIKYYQLKIFFYQIKKTEMSLKKIIKK